MQQTLPDEKTMYRALLEKNSGFEGIFVAGIKTTGIFCRPTCTARKPKKENVEYFRTSREALLRGYRPCKLCLPLAPKGDAPDWLKPLIEEIDDNPDLRLKDSDLRERGMDPNRVRRWFRKNHGMTFHTYMRTLRIGHAFGNIRSGDNVIQTAFRSGYESLSGFTESFKKLTGFSPNKSTHHRLVTITRISTPLGPMLAGATDEGVCLLEFVDRRQIETQLKRTARLLDADLLPGSHEHLDELDRQLKEYFDGKRDRFTVPLVITGTPFQKRQAYHRATIIFRVAERSPVLTV
jgi:AraC family transcriptional regulator of adaptative response/methylated-DNA-[protein]-cysteine methyltransferase